MYFFKVSRTAREGVEGVQVGIADRGADYSGHHRFFRRESSGRPAWSGALPLE
jgi:hypothetical protein